MCAHITAQCRRGQAWDWATNHEHVVIDPNIPFSLLLSLSLSHSVSPYLSVPLSSAPSCLSLPSITWLSPRPSLSILFSLHTLSIFYSKILNSIYHFLSRPPFFLSSQSSLSIFFLLVQSRPDAHFLKRFCFKSYLVLHIQMKNITALQNNWLARRLNRSPLPFRALLFTLSSCKNVWCLQPLQSSIDNGGPLLIKLLCLHPLPLLRDRKIKH